MQQVNQWLTRCGQGDSEAFRQLYQHTSPRLYGLCLQVLDDPVRAEQVLEAGFVQVWQSSAGYTPGREDAFVWMLRIFQKTARKTHAEKNQPTGRV